MPKKTGLGMGLDALFEDNSGSPQAGREVRISSIEPNKNQPRKNIDDESIAALADSIGRHGLVQPILVRPHGDGYQIVAGERRWRACRMLGMTEIPVIIKDFTDSQTAQIALIENIQREDLNPVEEAAAFRELMDKYGMTQEQTAQAVGKSRSSIANSVRLLSLPEPVLDLIKKGELSAGHAKVIAGLKQKDMLSQIAQKARNDGITVRKLEALVSELNGEASEEASSGSETSQKKETSRRKSTYITEMEISLNTTLSRKVKINSRDGEKGSITIDFFDRDDLSALADKLTLY